MPSSQRLVIRGGRVIDASRGVDAIGDVFVVDGRIAAPFESTTGTPEVEEFDARGAIVSPGFVDMHAHVMRHATPLGVDPDVYCLSNGVTTVIDAGSVGAATFPALRHFVASTSKTRVLCFLHVACHGLAAAGCSGPDFPPGGESDHLNALDSRFCAEIAKSNRDLVVGVKVRLDRSLTDGGRIEREVFRRACRAAKMAELPLMVHHTFSGIEIQPKKSIDKNDDNDDDNNVGLRKGDIYTHCFSSFAGRDACSIVDLEKGTIRHWARSLRESGVLFDLGHGLGSFSWDVAETAVRAGFRPDVVSSDLHAESLVAGSSGGSGGSGRGAGGLCRVMSKLMVAGMTLEQVLERVTMAPALASHTSHVTGSLSVGREADIVVFKVDETDEEIEDSSGKKRRMRKTIRPITVWRKGERVM